MDSSRMSESSRVSFEPTASDAEERSIGKRSMSIFLLEFFSFRFNRIWQKVKGLFTPNDYVTVTVTLELR